MICQQHGFFDNVHQRCPKCYPVSSKLYSGDPIPESPAPGTMPGTASPSGSPFQPVGTSKNTTVVRWNKKTDRSSSNAPSVNGAPQEEMDPVVGWLVAVDGPAKGRDFRVYNGNNSLGRSEACRIYVQDDPEISAKQATHITITYDHKENRYYIVPNPLVRSLVRTQKSPLDPEELLLVPTVLEPHHIIYVGGSKLMFVPFCNEVFRWDL